MIYDGFKMELIEIKNCFLMDTGAPSPTILSNDNELFVTFYENLEHPFFIEQNGKITEDMGIVILKFKRCIKHLFGSPGNETIHGHPYGKLGMESYAFYELKDSDLLKSMEEIDKVHPYYNPNKWKTFKHYIITFHDNMFECIALDFEVKRGGLNLQKQTKALFNEVTVKYFS